MYGARGMSPPTAYDAAIVNALAPGQRVRVRRIVILFGIYAACIAAHYAFDGAGSPKWASRMQFGAELLQAVTVVNIVSTLAFLVLLPKLGVGVPMIASDLAVGGGYILATLGVKVDDIHLVPLGAVPRTTSGKARRRECARLLETGVLG